MRKRRKKKKINMNKCLQSYKDSCDKYKKEDWLIDQVLYELCSKNPGHNRRDVINAKVSIIGRTYATGIERQILSDKKQQGSAMMKLQDCFYDYKEYIVPLLAPLKIISEPLNTDKLEKIVKIHGKLTQLIRKITRVSKKTREKLSPRSFVSKYMHFHCPAVPIFDNYAKTALNRHDLMHEVKWFPKNTDDTDETYVEYVKRFWCLYQHLNSRIKNLSVKLVDYYLLESTRKT